MTSRAELTALFDVSVLRTPSRFRGIGRYVAELAVALAQQSRSAGIHVVAIEALPWLAEATVTRDLAGAVARMSGAAGSHDSWAWRVRLRLPAAARRCQADLIHSGHPEATPLGEPRCPRIVTCHDVMHGELLRRYYGWRDGWSWGRSRLDRRRYRGADHVIAVSQATASDLMRVHGVAASRISIVHNGIDLSRWSPCPEEGDAGVLDRRGLRARGYLFYVGGADWRKNASGMIRALAEARRRRPGLELQLAWAGKLSRDEGSKLTRLAADAGVAGALRLLGFVADADLAALYRGALCELFVSRFEGFGYPIVEAMASGCPVVTSDVSCMAEIAGDAAVPVDCESPAAIAEAVLLLAEDERTRAELCRASLARARRFGLDRAAAETLEVYRAVARRS